ncbi:MAG: hypothetical protein AAFR52_13025 [Pseudomonadota bacterium]
MLDLAFDWFRNKGGDRAILLRNVAWAYHFLGAAGFVGSDLDTLRQRVARAGDAMRAAGLENTHHAWALLYDRLADWPDLAGYFLEGCASDPVIGFELSRAQKALLTGEGRRYVDLRTHPVRFLPDYFFAAATNDPALHERLATLQPPRRYVDQHVHFARARAARRYHDRLDPARDVVFFGQTAVDSSRIRDGALVDDLYILLEVEARLAAGPGRLHIKHHPHEQLPPPLLRELKALGGREIATATYDLLSVPGLGVMALSSSVCHEARYFDAAPLSLLDMGEPVAMIGEGTVPGDYVMMPANAHTPGIWDYLRHGGQVPDCAYPALATPFRAASGLAWG